MPIAKKLVTTFISEIDNERTAITYQTALNQFLKLMNRLKVDPINGDYRKIRSEIKDWAFEISTKYKDSTIKVKLAAISAFYQWLIDEKIRTDNPAVRVKLAKSQRVVVEKPPVVTSMANAVINALAEEYSDLGTDKALRDLVMVRVMRESGMRVSELLNLKVADFSPDFRVTVHNGKGAKKRTTAILPGTYDLVSKYVKKLKMPRKGYLFASWHFRRDVLSRETVVKTLERGAIRAGFTMDDVTICTRPHSWRHLWATEQANADTPLPRILSMGGWTDARMFLHYVNSDGLEAQAVNMMGGTE